MLTKKYAMVNIFCVNTQTSKSFDEGHSLLDILDSFAPDFERPYPILAAKVNNVCQGLKYRAFNSRQVQFLDYTSYAGRSVYCSSLCFLLCKAARDLWPDGTLTLRRPISKGYFCALDKGHDTALTQEDVDALNARMQELVDADLAFRRYEVKTDEAISMFEQMGYSDKVKLLQTSGDVYVNYYMLEDTADYYYEALVPSTGYLKVWNLSLYKGGMLLRVPDRHKPEQLAPFTEQSKTFEVFSENLRWNKIMGLDNVGDVNIACQNGEAPDLIKIAEALQEKKIVQIAEDI
jgi:uridine kinase